MYVLVILGNVCWPRRVLPLVSHVEYTLTDQTDGQTGRRTDARPLHFA